MTDPNQLAKQAAEEQIVVADQWSALLEPFNITNDEEQANVAGVLRDVKARNKYLEERRKEITVPLNNALKAVNDLFRPARERFDNIEKMLKGKIAAYLEEKSQANVATLHAAAAAPTPAEAQQTITQVVPIEPPQGVSVRYVWKYEVIAPEAVPHHYCSPDPYKIKEYMDFMLSHNSEPGIPGVNFFKEAIVTSRSK